MKKHILIKKMSCCATIVESVSVIAVNYVFKLITLCMFYNRYYILKYVSCILLVEID